MYSVVKAISCFISQQRGGCHQISTQFCHVTIECEEHHCPSFKEKFEACQSRVSEAEGGEESCVEEFFDLMVSNFEWSSCVAWEMRFRDWMLQSSAVATSRL